MLERIKVLKKDVVIDNRVCKVGDLVDVDEATAGRLTVEGAASYATQVRALRDNCMIGNRIAARGEVVGTTNRLAKGAIDQGQAEPYTAGMPDLPPAPAPEAAKPFDPYAAYGDMPRVKVKFLKEGFAGLKHHVVGEVATIPEARAADLVEAGVVQLEGLAKWTERGAHYLGQLRAKAQNWMIEATYH